MVHESPLVLEHQEFSGVSRESIILWGPAARKLRYHLIGSISRPGKAFLHQPSGLPCDCEFPLSRGTGTFCATFEGIAAPFWGIFVTNCQGQMRKEKFEGIATFLVRSGRSFRATGPR